MVAGLDRHAATVDRLLLSVLRGKSAVGSDLDVAALARIDPELQQWLETAAWHRVDPWAWLAVRRSSLAESPGGQELSSRYDYSVARHLRMIDDLRFIESALTHAGVSFAMFKGAVLAEAIYPRPDLRAYNDLDVLVHPRQFGAAVVALASQGCAVLDSNWSLLTSEGAGQIHLVTPMQTIVDLHWDLMTSPTVRTAFPISTEDLLRRATVLAVRGVVVPVLDPVDMMVHLCLHSSLAGGNRLCWLKDIAQLIEHTSVNWEAVVSRASQWRASIAVGVSVQRSAGAFQVAVPAEAMEMLISSPSWRAASRVVDYCFPPHRMHRRGPSVNRIVARSARGDGSATWSQFGKRATAALLKAAPLRRERHLWEVPEDDLRSARHRSGTFDDYLDYVEKQAYGMLAVGDHK